MTRLVLLSLRPGLHRCKSVQNSEETRPTTRLFQICHPPPPEASALLDVQNSAETRLIRLCLARLRYSTWRGARRRVE